MLGANHIHNIDNDNTHGYIYLTFAILEHGQLYY